MGSVGARNGIGDVAPSDGRAGRPAADGPPSAAPLDPVLGRLGPLEARLAATEDEVGQAQRARRAGQELAEVQHAQAFERQPVCFGRFGHEQIDRSYVNAKQPIVTENPNRHGRWERS